MSGKRGRIERLERAINTKRFGAAVDALLAVYDEMLQEGPAETYEDVPKGHMTVEHLRSNLIAHASVKCPPYARGYGQNFAEAILKESIERWTKLLSLYIESLERQESEGVRQEITAAKVRTIQAEWLKIAEAEPIAAGCHAVKRLWETRRQLKERQRAAQPADAPEGPPAQPTETER